MLVTFFFVYILSKKDTKIRKTMKYSEKMNSLKKAEGVPLLNLEGGPVVPLLNFEEGPGVILLNFRVVPCPTFKFEGSSGSHESRGPGSRILARLLSHAYVDISIAKFL